MHNEKTTMEHLQMATDSYGAVIAYGDFVLASAYRHLGKGKTGNDARVYKLAQQPIPGWGLRREASSNANSISSPKLASCSLMPDTPSLGPWTTPTNQRVPATTG